MANFYDTFQKFDWQTVQQKFGGYTSHEVEKVLQTGCKTVEDFAILISPAAQPYLETMAQQSRAITRQRFGNTMQLFAPMYLSNECENICTYCGFSESNIIPRKTLTDDEIHAEAKAIKALGFDHILLVTGEAHRTVGVPYLQNAIDIMRGYFSNVSIEVQPLKTREYETLMAHGLHSVLVYQETYHEANYQQYHTKGKKSNFKYRLETPDRLGEAGAYKIGIGALFGLEDWRTDAFFTALHLDYLKKQYWESKYSISFPRLRPAEGYTPKSIMTDADLIQLVAAYRLFDADVELSLSTREAPQFRNNAIHCGFTSMSAESKTNPGGYAVESESLEQFEISDERSAKNIATLLRNSGLEPVWKDWDRSYQVV